MELNAETRSVNEIFSPNKKYTVPRFQREYSWKEEEIDEFWDDIVQQIKVRDGKVRNEEYFIGCIVLVGEDTKPDYLIVDGQQRLTTLTILLRCIVARLTELGETAAANALYHNVIEGTDNDGDPYFKLVNETPKPFFQNELQSIKPENLKKAKTEEELLLQGAFNRFQKKIASLKFSGFSELDATKALREQVLNHLKFILVTAKNEDDAYTIFETLNARGLSLTSVDLIKNWIFKNYDQTHPNDNAKEMWGDIRKEISSFSDLETFFRHYWNSKYSFASNDRLYKSFKELLKKSRIAPARDFLIELQTAAKRYRKIGKPAVSDWPVQKEQAIGRALILLNQYKVTQVRPFLLAILEAREKGIVPQSTFLGVILNLESFHFAFSNLCQERASGLEGTYTRSAKKLHAAGANKVKAKRALTGLNESLIKKAPSAQKISASLVKLTFSKLDDSNRRIIQVIFRKIEQSLQGTNELQPGTFSLEHVQDQTKKAVWMSNIGNIIPLDEKINNGIKANLTFADKKKHYAKSSLKIVKTFLDNNPQDTWTKEDSDRWAGHLGVLLTTAAALQKL